MASNRTRYLYLVFFLSGMPALLYQVIWQRVLTLYFGVDIYTVSVIVGTFMLGLGIGSLLGGKLADRTRHPAVAYAWTELLVGFFGVISLPLFAAVGQRLAGGSDLVIVLANAALLLAPTTLMGMTLPLMARIVIGDDATIGRHLARLYAVNTFGAAVGALSASFLLIGLLGYAGGLYLAAGINVLLAVMVLGVVLGRVSAPAPTTAPAAAPPRAPASHAPAPAAAADSISATLGYWDVLGFSFLSGFVALGLQIAWYRILGCLLHGTVYVFGTILFVYLLGIALGSLRAARTIDRGCCASRFAIAQFGIGAYVLFTAVIVGYLSWLPGIRHVVAASMYTSFHPSPELLTGTIRASSLYSGCDIIFWSVFLLGLPTFLMGYGFPNLMREGSRVVARLGRSVGGVYFANIVGSTLGTVVIGFYVIHYRGTENSMRALVVLSALVPLAIFLRQLAASGSAAATTYFARNPGWLYASVVLMAINTMVFPVRPAILRAIHLADFHEKVEFIGQEDASGVVALRKQHQIVAFDEERRALGAWRLHIDGARHGGFASDDLEEMRWIEVDVALAAHPAPRRGLCIGLGDGRMCYSAVSTPGVQELVVVELNSVLRDVLSKIPPGKALLDSPKLRDVVGDGRHWLLDNPNERFDFIMMFPLHAAHANSGALFSLEALTLLKQHLNPGGIVYLCSTDAYSTAKTMATVFPYVVRLGTAHYICGLEPIRLDVARTGMAYDGLSSLLSADQDTILANTADAPLNRDFHPNSEYYVTYPFAWVLRTLNQDKRIFSEPDPKRLAGIIPKGQADPPGP